MEFFLLALKEYRKFGILALKLADDDHVVGLFYPAYLANSDEI